MSDLVTTNIGKMSVVSMVLAVIVNIALLGLTFGQIEANQGISEMSYPSWITSSISKNVPKDYVCQTGDEVCIKQLENVPTEDTGLIDKSQQLINVVPIIGGMLVIIAMTPILPSVINYKIMPFITNEWVLGIVTIFFTLWTMLNIYLIYMLLFKK